MQALQISQPARQHLARGTSYLLRVYSLTLGTVFSIISSSGQTSPAVAQSGTAIDQSSRSQPGRQATVPVITTRSPIGVVVAAPFSYAIEATHSPTVYSASGLPRGLTCDSATGIISGVTAVVGTARVTLRATNAFGTGVATQTLLVDGITPIEMPVVSRVSLPQTGDYRAGETLTIVLEVDAPYGGLVVTGTPRVALTLGEHVRYASSVSMDTPAMDTATTRPRLRFTYVIAPEDTASSGITIGPVIELNGGTIRDRTGLHCASSLPETAPALVRVSAPGPTLAPQAHARHANVDRRGNTAGAHFVGKFEQVGL